MAGRKNGNFLKRLKDRVITKKKDDNEEKKDQLKQANKLVNGAASSSSSSLNGVSPRSLGAKKVRIKHENRSQSRSGSARPRVQRDDLLQKLKSIREVEDSQEKIKLFVKKLRLCSYVFDFRKETKDKLENEAREMKRRMLVELIDHLSSSKEWASEDALRAILRMISANLFRALPASLYDDFDPDEDEPTHDPAWVHLQFVYEFLLRFIVSNNTDTKMLKRFIDRNFLLSIIDLFNSEDPRERDYLKTILHRLYGKFMSFRSFLRKAINNVFYNVIYVTQRHNGLAELLEILGSIINGFATPLKPEHQSFLRNVLIPLHKVKTLSTFHAQLAYCVVQFIEKDPILAISIIGGLLKFWPVTSASKEILFLSELEEVLEMTEPRNFEKIITPVFRRIAACIASEHFQVSERALFMWNNDVIAAFMSEHRPEILPILYPALARNVTTHWNKTVSELTNHILIQFRDMDLELYHKCKQQYEVSPTSEEIKEARAEKWRKVYGKSNSAKIDTESISKVRVETKA